MNSKAFLSLVALIIFLRPGAQNTIDSLKAVIQTSAESNEVLNACINLSAQYNLQSFDENLLYARKGLNIASQKNDSLSIGKLYHNLGVAHYFEGRYDSAAL